MSGLGLALGASRMLGVVAHTDWLVLLKRYWWLAAAASLGGYIAILHGEISHCDKMIASQTSLLGAVKTEVDRGVGTPTQAADAPAYIHSFVANLATATAALDRQSAALKMAEQQAANRRAAATKAAGPTPAQRQREAIRQQIVNPGRVDGLSAEEWSQL
jgi:hypothetical protein